MKSLKWMLLACVSVWWMMSAPAGLALCAEKLAPGAGRFEVTHDGQKIPVWYYLPTGAGPETPVLIAMHGVNRDADRYRDEWLPHAQKYDFLLLAPEFSSEAFPGEEKYNQGNTHDAKSRPLPRGEWTFRFIEPVFDAAKAATGNRTPQYYFYGHSAGAQFVHRFLYFMPEARVAGVVAANAGWWTVPEPAVQFPYGLDGSGLNAATIKTMLGRPLVVLLGTADTDANHPNLRRTKKALAQGPHRYARGRFFYDAGKRHAASLGVPFEWQLATAPNVGHSDKGMAPFAVRHLFPRPTITSRDPSRVRILLGGDTSGGESYHEEYARKGGVNVLEEKGYAHGVAQLNRLMASVDYRVINLETPLTARRDSPYPTKDYLHYSDPVKLPALFMPHGPAAFSLANNHTLDHGGEGLDDTRAALSAAGADWFGAGENLREAARPLVQTFRVGERKVTLALFGSFEYRRNYDEDYHIYAQADRPGTAPLDIPAVKQAIAELRREVPEAFVVYFVHWGGNYEWKSEAQATAARDLRIAGIDLVVGHGAHTLEEVDYDGRGWIFYSIGNFLFNAEGRYAKYDVLPFSLPLVVELAPQADGLRTTLRAYPILSDNLRTGYQPRFVTQAELEQIETTLAKKSHWNAPSRAAVRPGQDEIGSFLEFGTPR